MLGNYIKSYLSKSYEIIPLTRKDYDISNLSIDSLSQFLLNKKIQKNDIIINCAGVIPQASKQRTLDTKLYFQVNSLFPVILSQLCEKFETKMIHITTDCVFSGKTGNYDENSVHDEINDYGMSKSLGELCKATIIRTSIIGEEINNKRSLLEWVKSNKDKTIKGFTNHHWNGVTCLQLAKIIKKIIDENLYWVGIRHFYSPRNVTKYKLVTIINNIYNLNATLNEYKTDETINKTLTSIYNNNLFEIPDLLVQIIEQKNYTLINNE